LRGIDEIEKGALGVNAGDDRLGGDFFSVGEDDRGDATVLDANVLEDAGVVIRALLAFPERLRQCCHFGFSFHVRAAFR
jgi:hypothetical protein